MKFILENRAGMKRFTLISFRETSLSNYSEEEELLLAATNFKL